ncbi:MAG: TetR/AcrR family transcriptional regulator [Thermoleophilia bacterium]
MDSRDRPGDDPTAQLSPTARRLVVAARKLLARGGYGALTVEAVAAEAGAYRDSVRYYFGSKAAFIAAVVDSLSHEQSLSAYNESQALPAGAPRVHRLMASDRQLVEERDGFRDFFAMLPHVLQDEELRLRVAALYDWYRDLYVKGMGEADGEGDAERLRGLASLMTAMADGLAVQKLLDPAGTDLEALFALWEGILRRELLGDER